MLGEKYFLHYHKDYRKDIQTASPKGHIKIQTHSHLIWQENSFSWSFDSPSLLESYSRYSISYFYTIFTKHTYRQRNETSKERVTGQSHRSKSSSRGKSHETVRSIGDVANESFARKGERGGAEEGLARLGRREETFLLGEFSRGNFDPSGIPTRFLPRRIKNIFGETRIAAAPIRYICTCIHCDAARSQWADASWRDKSKCKSINTRIISKGDATRQATMLNTGTAWMKNRRQDGRTWKVAALVWKYDSHGQTFLSTLYNKFHSLILLKIFRQTTKIDVQPPAAAIVRNRLEHGAWRGERAWEWNSINDGNSTNASRLTDCQRTAGWYVCAPVPFYLCELRSLRAAKRLAAERTRDFRPTSQRRHDAWKTDFAAPDGFFSSLRPMLVFLSLSQFPPPSLTSSPLPISQFLNFSTRCFHVC